MSISEINKNILDILFFFHLLQTLYSEINYFFLSKKNILITLWIFLLNRTVNCSSASLLTTKMRRKKKRKTQNYFLCLKTKEKLCFREFMICLRLSSKSTAC